MTNRLATASSPYLQQHAHNPVDWYPWGSEALEKARRDNKPILLSIGYAACHWCHVMAHESFEDKETADVMNQLFINIKVDREERPDLDKIYQTAHYFLTQQSGGWPLTIFLSPQDFAPFFSGTYFPREAHYQLPAFKDVLKNISAIYHQHYDEIRRQNASLLNFLQYQSPVQTNIELNKEPIQLAITSLQHDYDPYNGGFNGAPKFPQPTRLKLLMRNNNPIATTTLAHMARGGIYDQLSGGFFRYSVDAKWEIPHFEKMLYDNAQLLLLYTLADHVDVARDTAHWVMNTMQSPLGGYYSSLDADSEGHEGKYYVWDTKEVASLLTPSEYHLLHDYFNLQMPANFENQWHLHITEPLSSVAEKLNMPLNDANQLFLSAKEKMLAARDKRIAPFCDKKILTAWNSLMIKAMMTAGDKLKLPECIESAQAAMTFIQEKLWIHQRLIASLHEEKADLPAYLDDYVFLIDALISSLQVAWHTQHLLFAIELTETLLNHFADETHGGFYFTANDHEQLLYRPKTMMDEATPSGNGVAVRVLLTLGYLLGEPRYLNAAEKTLQAAWPALMKFPAEHGSLLEGLNDFLEPPQIIVIRGKNPDMQIWREKCQRNDNYVFAIPDHEQHLPESLASKTAKKHTCAYVCQGTHCLDVIEDVEKMSHIQ